jgi:hypothetical protein
VINSQWKGKTNDKWYACQKSAIGKKIWTSRFFQSLFINYVKNINETHPSEKQRNFNLASNKTGMYISIENGNYFEITLKISKKRKK